MRILALDIGEARTGVAVCDELQISVTPLCTLQRVGRLKADIAQAVDIVLKESPELVLIGMPTSSDGGEGSQAKRVRGFGDALAKAISIPIVYWDESLTTVEAEERLIELGYSRQKRRDLIDQWAAKVLLESYLAHKSL